MIQMVLCGDYTMTMTHVPFNTKTLQERRDCD